MNSKDPSTPLRLVNVRCFDVASIVTPAMGRSLADLSRISEQDTGCCPWFTARSCRRTAPAAHVGRVEVSSEVVSRPFSRSNTRYDLPSLKRRIARTSRFVDRNLLAGISAKGFGHIEKDRRTVQQHLGFWIFSAKSLFPRRPRVTCRPGNYKRFSPYCTRRQELCSKGAESGSDSYTDRMK